MIEKWRDVCGYDGKYQISNHGRVKSFYFGENFLVPKINNRGYLWVELAKNRKRKALLIHRLVAIAFLDNLEGLPIVNHKDENPKNNRVDNLEWCDYSYNILYSLSKRPNRPRRISLKRSMAINQLSLDGVLLKRWDNANVIKKTLLKNEWNIVECCRGNRKTAYGYKWEFA